VLISNDFDTTKNPKLVPNWKGPGKIIDINDTNAKIKFKNKVKVLDVAKLKHFYKNIKKSVDKGGDAAQFNQNFNQPDTINTLCDPSNNCAWCESEETYLAESKMLPFQWRQLKLAEQCCKQWQLKLMKKEASKINSAEDRCHSKVPERFREPLMKVAHKLLSRDEATFEELTPSEQKLWTSFETDQIY
jgi:hypothetical protein